MYMYEQQLLSISFFLTAILILKSRAYISKGVFFSLYLMNIYTQHTGTCPEGALKLIGFPYKHVKNWVFPLINIMHTHLKSLIISNKSRLKHRSASFKVHAPLINLFTTTNSQLEHISFFKSKEFTYIFIDKNTRIPVIYFLKIIICSISYLM